MPFIADRYIVADNISEAWRDAVLHFAEAGVSTKNVHLVIRVADPTVEDPSIRAMAEAMLAAHNAGKEEGRQFWPIDTVRNTIFPAAWARRFPNPDDLAEYYRERYPQLRKIDANKFGTYFGRLVAYPRDEKHENQYNQLSTLLFKLRRETTPGLSGRPSNLSSCYEVNVFSERWDTNRMSFPCLAHLSFHVHDGKLHMQAVYRNEFLGARAYGNYLGLAELLVYIASACPALEPGELMFTINHVELDVSKRLITDNVS